MQRQQDSFTQDCINTLESFLKEAKHSEESFEDAESALINLEHCFTDKKLIDNKCKAYTILIKEILDKKSLAETEIKKAESLLEKLQENIKKLSAMTRDVEAHQRQLQKFRENIDRVKLMGNTSVAKNPVCLFNKDEEATAALDDARRQVAEMEETGKNILKNVGEQKEQIKKANKNLHEIGGDLSVSSRLISKMGKWWRG